MKKAFLFIAAAMAIFAGCKKEQPAQALKSDNIIHIGVKQIAPPTKVAADDITADKLSFNWEEGDQVCFINTSSNIIYTCTNPETGEFSGEALNPEATYEVHYPASFVESYVFSGIYRGNQIPKAHHIANWSVSGSATTFTLDAHNPIIHFKLKGDAKIGKIKLSNAEEGQPIYTLSCGDEGVQLSDEPIDFYMDAHLLDKNRLSGYAYTLSIRDTQDAELKSVSFHLTATNLGTMVDFSTPIEVNASSLPEGALSGVFSVSATKQVHFSKGNLVATVNDSGAPTAWKFATNQYDCLGEGGANKTIGMSDGDIDLFGWSTKNTTYGISTSTSSGKYLGDFVDWGKNIGDGNTWRTLSNDEWKYLFITRTASTVNGTENARYAKAKVNDIKGVILLPDTYTHPEGVTPLTNINTSGAAFTVNTYVLTDWAKMESAGAVFLPAAGNRSGTAVENVGDIGRCWSSTAYDNTQAHRVYFNSSMVNPGNYDNRNIGLSVRLITDVE